MIACSGAGCRQKLYRATDIHGIVSDDGDFSNINSSGLAFVRGAIAQIHADGIARGVDPFCETTSESPVSRSRVKISSRYLFLLLLLRKWGETPFKKKHTHTHNTHTHAHL